MTRGCTFAVSSFCNMAGFKENEEVFGHKKGQLL